MTRHVYRKRTEPKVAARVWRRQRCRIGLMMARHHLHDRHRWWAKPALAVNYSGLLDHWMVHI